MHAGIPQLLIINRGFLSMFGVFYNSFQNALLCINFLITSRSYFKINFAQMECDVCHKTQKISGDLRISQILTCLFPHSHMTLTNSEDILY